MKHFKLWIIILLMYITILVGIGQIAFTKQYFNEAESMVGEFLDIKEQYQIDGADQESTDSLINALIESSADSSSDLQELASQSFNIILGALLAFLSASATVVFQSQADRSDEDSDTPDGNTPDTPPKDKEPYLAEETNKPAPVPAPSVTPSKPVDKTEEDDKPGIVRKTPA